MQSRPNSPSTDKGTAPPKRLLIKVRKTLQSLLIQPGEVMQELSTAKVPCMPGSCLERVDMTISIFTKTNARETNMFVFQGQELTLSRCWEAMSGEGRLVLFVGSPGQRVEPPCETGCWAGWTLGLIQQGSSCVLSWTKGIFARQTQIYEARKKRTVNSRIKRMQGIWG